MHWWRGEPKEVERNVKHGVTSYVCSNVSWEMLQHTCYILPCVLALIALALLDNNYPDISSIVDNSDDYSNVLPSLQTWAPFIFKLQLSVICSQGLVARGGLGLGGGCCTGVAARMTTPASAGAAGALSANAAARAATKIANAGWVEAGQLVKKQLAYAEQASIGYGRGVRSDGQQGHKMFCYRRGLHRFGKKNGLDSFENIQKLCCRNKYLTLYLRECFYPIEKAGLLKNKIPCFQKHEPAHVMGKTAVSALGEVHSPCSSCIYP